MNQDFYQKTLAPWEERFKKYGMPFPMEGDMGPGEVELLLQEFLAREMREFEPALVKTRLKDINNKWRVVSAVQKAVRRGQVQQAIRAGHAVSVADNSYFWRRIGVIALEDVAFGGIVECALTLTAMRYRKLRRLWGEDKILQYITTILAEAHKDRAATDMVCHFLYGDIGGIKAHYEEHGMGLEEITATACDRSNPDWEQRGAAAWLLAGTKWVENDNLPYRPSVEGAFEVYAKNGYPPLVQYVTLRARACQREPMYIVFPVVWDMIMNSSEITFEEKTFTMSTPVAGLQPEALDQHTADGKRAMGYFAKANDEMRDWFSKNPGAKPSKAIGIVLFIHEGGLLDSEVMFDGRKQLYELVVRDDYLNSGVTDEQYQELYPLVLKNMEDLNHARARVVEPK